MMQFKTTDEMESMPRLKGHFDMLEIKYNDQSKPKQNNQIESNTYPECTETEDSSSNSPTRTGLNGTWIDDQEEYRKLKEAQRIANEQSGDYIYRGGYYDNKSHGGGGDGYNRGDSGGYDNNYESRGGGGGF